MRPVLLLPEFVSGDFRVWCARFSVRLPALLDDCSPTIDYGCTADVLPHAVYSTYSVAFVSDVPLVYPGSNSGKIRSMANSYDSTRSDNSCGSVRGILHNTSGWKDSDDRSWDSSSVGSSRDLSRSRPGRRKSRDRCNDAKDANDKLGCTVESL